jgi:hypothetical protein
MPSSSPLPIAKKNSPRISPIPNGALTGSSRSNRASTPSDASNLPSSRKANPRPRKPSAKPT